MNLIICIVSLPLGLANLDVATTPNTIPNHLENYLNLLSSNLYGNTHSINPSAKRSDHVIISLRETLLNLLKTDFSASTVVFVNGKDTALKLLVCFYY